MRQARLALILALLAAPLPAAYRRVGEALPERFDAAQRSWVPLPASLDYDPDTGLSRLVLPAMPAVPLNARWDFQHFPRYSAWFARRQSQGGLTWPAVRSLLADIGDGPALLMTEGPLPRQGPAEIQVGLRRGSRFKLYATVEGDFSPCPEGLCFAPQRVAFSSRTAKVAWMLSKPLVLRWLKKAAGH
jgi:hypothetical protein